VLGFQIGNYEVQALILNDGLLLRTSMTDDCHVINQGLRDSCLSIIRMREDHDNRVCLGIERTEGGDAVVVQQMDIVTRGARLVIWAGGWEMEVSVG
jgi:hypothetical protein